MLIVGKQAPEFILDGVQEGEIKSVNSLQFYGKYVLYFFYQDAFSNICSNELLALQENLHNFEKRGVKVLAISTDSVYAHIEWLNTPIEEGGINGITFTLLSDARKGLARDFGVLNEDQGVSLRGAFIVNRLGQVVYASINNVYVGRNTDELVRLIDAFQYTEKHRDLCPIDWQPGDETIPDDRQGSRQYYTKKFG